MKGKNEAAPITVLLKIKEKKSTKNTKTLIWGRGQAIIWRFSIFARSLVTWPSRKAKEEPTAGRAASSAAVQQYSYEHFCDGREVSARWAGCDVRLYIVLYIQVFVGHEVSHASSSHLEQ